MDQWKDILTYIGLIGLTLTILTTSSGVVWWLATKLGRINANFPLIDEKFNNIDTSLDRLSDTVKAECGNITAHLTRHNEECNPDRTTIHTELKRMNRRLEILEQEKQ